VDTGCINASNRALIPNELRRVGIDALVKSLGPLGMVRFIQQFDTGKGDYTKERSELLGSLSLDVITAVIEDERH
jgi:hypothetical protein